MANQTAGAGGGVLDKEQILMLIKELRDFEGDIRDEALYKLKGMDYNLLHNILANIFNDQREDFASRCDAILAMLLVRGSEDASLIAPLLSDPDSSIRSWVCEVLYYHAKKGDEQVMQPLIAVLLHDPVVEVRIQAAVALRTVGDKQTIQPLQYVHQHDFQLGISGHTVSEVAGETLKRISLE